MWRRWKKRLPTTGSTSVTFLSPSTPVPFSVAANNKDGEDPTMDNDGAFVPDVWLREYGDPKQKPEDPTVKEWNRKRIPPEPTKVTRWMKLRDTFQPVPGELELDELIGLTREGRKLLKVAPHPPNPPSHQPIQPIL